MRVNTFFILLCLVATFFALYTGLPAEILAYSYHNLKTNHAWWTPVTALFVHGSLLHLGGNVLFMILFGYPLEKIMGGSRFAACFLAGGVFSFLLSRFFYPPGDFLLVGASGAICTVIAMMMLYDPWKLSPLLVGFPMPLGVAGLTYVLFNFWMAKMPRDGVATMHVAYEAHIIGFALGILFSAFVNPDWKRNLLICILMFVAYYVIAFWLINHFAR